jgi:hypothetical protein
VGPHGGRGTGVGFRGNPRNLGIFSILLSFPPRVVQPDAQGHVLIKSVGNIATDQEILNLVPKASAEGCDLGFLIPVEDRHVADESGVVGGARLGALLHGEELALGRGFCVGILEGSSEPPNEVGPRPKSDGAVLLVDMRCEPLLGRATEEVARVGDLGDVVGKRCFIGVENQTLYVSGLETLGDLEFSEFEFEEFLDVATISEYLYPCQKNSL